MGGERSSPSEIGGNPMKANVFGNELYNQLMDDLAEVEERRE